MSGAINNTGASHNAGNIAPSNQPKSSNQVDSQDAEDFLNQVNEENTNAENEDELQNELQNEILDTMKRTIITQQQEQQKKMMEEIKKDLE